LIYFVGENEDGEAEESDDEDGGSHGDEGSKELIKV